MLCMLNATTLLQLSKEQNTQITSKINYISHSITNQIPFRFVIGAHYDSQNELNNGNLPAPGALDNASGTATVIELARVLGPMELPYTLEFVLFAGKIISIKFFNVFSKNRTN